jgi:hypothetical protein
VEIRVAAAGSQQFGVAAALDDLAGLDHQDQAGVPDRAQAVRDDNAGASTQRRPKNCL